MSKIKNALPLASDGNDVAFLAAFRESAILLDYETNRVFGTRGSGGRPILPRPLAIMKDRCGYLRVRFVWGGRKWRVSLHRAVWMATHGRLIAPGHDIDHIDADPLNNRPENLRPLLRRDNLARRGSKSATTEESW